jgi:cell division transport system permease protein
MKNKEAGTIRRRLRTSYITSVISISLVLLLMGIVGILILNAHKVSDYVKENIGFSIIIKETAKEADIIRLQKILDTKTYVKSTEYITKEKAAMELQNDLGEDFLKTLGYNPLLPSIDIKLYASYANNDSIAKIKSDFSKYDLISEVVYQESLVHLINENVRKISAVVLLFSGMLLFIALALINNTIRLSIYSKRFLIHTMQLVGATRSFIRWPFLFRSILQGIYGSLIAIILLLLALYFAQMEIAELVTFNDYRMIGLLLVFEISAGVIISLISTFFAVNKYLNIHIDKLYYS